MDHHHDLSAYHADGSPPLLIWIRVVPRRRYRIVKHENRCFEAEAVRLKVRLVLGPIPNPTQTQSSFTILRECSYRNDLTSTSVPLLAPNRAAGASMRRELNADGSRSCSKDSTFQSRRRCALGPTDVRAVTEAIFDKMGLSQADAARSADVLVYADLKGIDTHGISNMLRMYVRGYQTGENNPRPQPRIVRESPAVATMDGDGGLGLHIGPHAMELAIEKAKSHGMGRCGGAKRWARRRSRLSTLRWRWSTT